MHAPSGNAVWPAKLTDRMSDPYRERSEQNLDYDRSQSHTDLSGLLLRSLLAGTVLGARLQASDRQTPESGESSRLPSIWPAPGGLATTPDSSFARMRPIFPEPCTLLIGVEVAHVTSSI